MALVDCVYILIIALFSVIGALNGLIREVFGKLAIIIGVIAGMTFTGMLQIHVSKFVANPMVATVAAFFLIFVCAFLTVKIVQILMQSLFDGEILGGLDHTLGLFFGAFEGAVFVCFFMVLMVSQPWYLEVQTFAKKGLCFDLLSPFISQQIDYMKGVFINV